MHSPRTVAKKGVSSIDFTISCFFVSVALAKLPPAALFRLATPS